MTPDNDNRIEFRLPQELMSTLRRRIAGRRSRWSTPSEWAQERLIYDIERSHGGKKESDAEG